MTHTPQKLVTFAIGPDEYAIDIAHVLEIVEAGAITRVPSVPAFIRGATNLRGRPMPVIDLGMKFGLPPRERTKWSCFVVVHVPIAGSLTNLALFVDEMREFVEDAGDRILPPPPLGTRVHADYLIGPPNAGEAFTLVPDLEKVLSAEERAAAP